MSIELVDRWLVDILSELSVVSSSLLNDVVATNKPGSKHINCNNVSINDCIMTIVFLSSRRLFDVSLLSNFALHQSESAQR